MGGSQRSRASALAAERALGAAQPPGVALSPADLQGLIEGLGDVVGVLPKAAEKQRAKVYEELGVSLVYDHLGDQVEVTLAPELACAKGGVGGGITPSCTPAVLRAELLLRCPA